MTARPRTSKRSQNAPDRIYAVDQPLGGNQSAAVKVGDTVHRRAGPWTPAVHALLEHLQRMGFGAAPEPIGMDGQGRAVLRFMNGDVHEGWPDPMPDWMFQDEGTLVGAAQLLRRYHDLVTAFRRPADARWRIVAPPPHEVICHNDWAPYNALFEGHRPTAMLDWDSAGPGSRVWDVAYSAYTWVPLKPEPHDRTIPLEARASRLARFCAAYGGVAPAEVLATLVDQLRFLADVMDQQAERGDPGALKLVGWGAPARSRDHAVVIRDQTRLLLGRR
jgi:hypothetical protein